MKYYVFQKEKGKSTAKTAKNAFERMHEIYENGHYPIIEMIRPQDTENPKISGEFALPKVYEYYLQWEFIKLLEMGNILSIKTGREIRHKDDPDFLRYCEEYIDQEKQKLFLFTPERIELSCDRLKHYTNTDPNDFQQHILITNYSMYMEMFQQLFPNAVSSKGSAQMPTLHAKQKNKRGISMINMGVGPANAKTLTDQIAVLRPSCMIMIGHCGGLKNHQNIGDFLLADKFIRDDHVLDVVLSQKIPATSTLIINTLLLNEIQKRKFPYRIGTVFTTNNRDWEYKISHYQTIFQESRSYGIDMESSVVCGQGFRYKIPNATLLMVSDKPLHGKLKLSKSAEDFYHKSKKAHVEIAISAIKALDAIKKTHLDLSGLESFPGSKLDALMW